MPGQTPHEFFRAIIKAGGKLEELDEFMPKPVTGAPGKPKPKTHYFGGRISLPTELALKWEEGMRRFRSSGYNAITIAPIQPRGPTTEYNFSLGARKTTKRYRDF